MPIQSIFQVPRIGSEVFVFQDKLKVGTVLERENRFIVRVNVNGEEVRCHLHDPGRLKELVFPGNTVLLRPTAGVKTSFSVTACRDAEEWVVTDTRIHPQIASMFLPPGIKKEITIGNHRIDYALGNQLIELKGCTLLTGTVAMFPDAPTIRGFEHLKLLRRHINAGGKAALIVLILRSNAKCFSPNRETDHRFASELGLAVKDGFELFLPRFSFDGKSIVYTGSISLCNEPA